MPGPKGVITIDSTFERAFECANEAVQYADAALGTEEMQRKAAAWLGAGDSAELKKVHATSSSSPEELGKAAGAFEPAKDAKEVEVGEDGRTLHVGTELSPK
jgi:hypothetical protein